MSADFDPSQRLPRVSRRIALGQGTMALAGIALMPGSVDIRQFDPNKAAPLTPDYGGAWVDRSKEGTNSPIGSARFIYDMNYRPSHEPNGAVEMSLFLRQPEGGLLRVVSQQYYDDPTKTRTLFAGTYQFAEMAMHSTHPVIDATIGDRLGIAAGVFPKDADPRDPATLKGLSLYTFDRLENQDPGYVILGKGTYRGLIDFDESIFESREQQGDFDALHNVRTF